VKPPTAIDKMSGSHQTPCWRNRDSNLRSPPGPPPGGPYATASVAPPGGLRKALRIETRYGAPQRCRANFVADSLLEGNGFEPSVPREIGLRSGSVNRRQTGRRRSDHGDTAMAVGAVDESCRLNRGNLNILSEARIHAPELIGYQVSVDPI
jgi:hypothetical protein